VAIKKLIKYGAIILSALSGNTTPESEFLLQEMEYDEKGNVIVDSKYNTDGELEERHSYTFNQNNSLVSHSVEMPLDEVVERFNYDRNESDQLVTVTKYYGKEEGERTMYVYDESNLPVTITNYDADGELNSTENYTYNEQKLVVKKVINYHTDESQSKTHLYEYNDKGLLMLYTVEGNNEKTTTAYTYNAHGLEEKCIQDSSNGKKLLEITSEYDENLRLVKRSTKGYYIRITSIAYDKQGRVWEEQLSDENNFVIARNAFEYTDDGRIAEEVVYETDLTRAGRDTHMIMRYEYELF
jgi:hypothetical protein